VQSVLFILSSEGCY